MQEEIEEAKRSGRAELDGRVASSACYDTYGVPIEVVREIAEEERFAVDEAGFQRALEEQRERSRGGLSASQGGLRQVAEVIDAAGYMHGPAAFVGYDQLTLPGQEVMEIVRLDDSKPPENVGRLAAGESGVVVFARTVFYAESGGQVGDRGIIVWPDGRARVTDTQKALR